VLDRSGLLGKQEILTSRHHKAFGVSNQQRQPDPRSREVARGAIHRRRGMCRDRLRTVGLTQAMIRARGIVMLVGRSFAQAALNLAVADLSPAA
jgi:hypothetical protein